MTGVTSDALFLAVAGTLNGQHLHLVAKGKAGLSALPIVISIFRREMLPTDAVDCVGPGDLAGWILEHLDANQTTRNIVEGWVRQSGFDRVPWANEAAALAFRISDDGQPDDAPHEDLAQAIYDLLQDVASMTRSVLEASAREAVEQQQQRERLGAGRAFQTTDTRASEQQQREPLRTPSDDPSAGCVVPPVEVEPSNTRQDAFVAGAMWATPGRDDAIGIQWRDYAEDEARRRYPREE